MKNKEIIISCMVISRSSISVLHVTLKVSNSEQDWPSDWLVLIVSQCRTGKEKVPPQIAAWDIIKIVTLTSDGLASHLDQFTSKGVDFLKAVTQRTFVVKKISPIHSLGAIESVRVSSISFDVAWLVTVPLVTSMHYLDVPNAVVLLLNYRRTGDKQSLNNPS